MININYITPQDMRVCSCIETYGDGSYYGKVEYMFNEKAICALIGHPLVFWEDTPNVRVEIVKGEPELLVKKEKLGRLTLEFSPKLPPSQNILNIKETPTRIKVIEITSEHRRITEILGKDNKLNVPRSPKNKFWQPLMLSQASSPCILTSVAAQKVQKKYPPKRSPIFTSYLPIRA